MERPSIVVHATTEEGGWNAGLKYMRWNEHAKN